MSSKLQRVRPFATRPARAYLLEFRVAASPVRDDHVLTVMEALERSSTWQR